MDAVLSIGLFHLFSFPVLHFRPFQKRRSNVFWVTPQLSLASKRQCSCQQTSFSTGPRNISGHMTTRLLRGLESAVGYSLWSINVCWLSGEINKWAWNQLETSSGSQIRARLCSSTNSREFSLNGFNERLLRLTHAHKQRMISHSVAKSEEGSYRQEHIKMCWTPRAKPKHWVWPEGTIRLQ